MMPGIADGGLKELGENVEVKSIVLTLNPTPSVLTISARITAIPGTKAAQNLSRGSPALRQIAEKLGAKEPGLMGPEFSAVSTLLPSAGQADFAGTFNLMKLLALAAALAPIPVPVPDANVPVSSSIAYAIAVNLMEMVLPPMVMTWNGTFSERKDDNYETIKFWNTCCISCCGYGFSRQ